MAGPLMLFTGIMVIAAGFKSLSASDVCREEVSRLREHENLLKVKLHKQQILIHRLTQMKDDNQPGNHQPDNNKPGNADTAVSNQSQQDSHTDCSQLFLSGSRSSGPYRIKPVGCSSPVRVYCDQSDGGGWTVLQRRVTGTENFNRSWSEYRDGFGDMDSDLGEFWIGNDNLHYITNQGNYSLRIYLEDFDGNQRYADYKDFRVADEKDHYRLTFGAYVGTAGDALSGTYQLGVSDWAGHQGVKFSTFDQDNDNYKGNCALEDKGGWWFNKCHSAHLNGVYYPGGHYSSATDDGIVWFPWRGWWYSLKTSIMKLRPTDYKMAPIDDPNTVNKKPPS